MTVEELIEKLKKYPKDFTVVCITKGDLIDDIEDEDDMIVKSVYEFESDHFKTKDTELYNCVVIDAFY